jgi:hypothetical protein
MLKFNVITDILAIQLIRSNLPSENSVYNSIEFSLNLHSSRYIFLNDNFLVIFQLVADVSNSVKTTANCSAPKD